MGKGYSKRFRGRILSDACFDVHFVSVLGILSTRVANIPPTYMITGLMHNTSLIKVTSLIQY